MSKLPRPGFNYRVARRNAWKAIPSKDRPSWSEFNEAFQRGGHDIVGGKVARDPFGLKTRVHGMHVMYYNKSKYAATYDGHLRSVQREAK